jgi:cellulose synthase/poly-beta-1,6-N-acetylglucosamine synthase-like glycosyltransferase
MPGAVTDLAAWLLVAMVLLGAVPVVVSMYQFALVGLHRWRNHYGRCADHVPRTAVLVPAWNEAAVLDTSIDQLMALDYPRERLRVYVVDDASTDDTPAVLARLAERYPGAVVHLRRERGGEGKAHTLNHGLAHLLADDWMQATLVMDADVVYEPDSLRKMARHLADPHVGAVMANIKEGSRPGTTINRFIAYEYVHAQGASRRAQEVLGAIACLAGGAQLHSRANLEALGGRFVTTTLAEDTVTTFTTQLDGRKVVFEPDAVAWAEEPSTVDALWKQRLRWARGNLDVTRMFRRVWFRPAGHHRLGSASFGLFWFSTMLLPVLMITSSVALVTLFFTDFGRSFDTFRVLWITTALCFVYITAFALLLDPGTARRAWREALAFPGVVALAIIFAACFPDLAEWVRSTAEDLVGHDVTPAQARAVMLFAYVWVSGSMLVGFAARGLDRRGWPRLARALVYVGGFGPLLCAVTFDSYIQHLRGARQTWDKTEKTGTVAMRS